MRTLALLLGVLIAAADAGDYVVLDGTAGRAAFRPAVERLKAHRDALVVPFDPADLDAAARALLRAGPAYVAVVLPPEAIEFDFQRRFLRMATRIDEDPFVDFAYGYVTGATGEDALALVEAGIRAEKEPRAFVLGSLCGGGDASGVHPASIPLRKSMLPGVRAFVKGEGEEHDRTFVREFLPRLRSCGIVELVGHGMPRRVVGGPDWRDLEGWTLDAPVVLSVPCYTGVTRVWYEDDWRAGLLRRREIPLAESFALRVLAAGPCGYTAYLCPRPAGPDLTSDLVRLAVDGMTLGDARRRDYDKTVLGFLGFGEERFDPAPLVDGAKLLRGDPVRDMMLEGATGGVLYGDPAVRPFAPRPGEDPVQVDAHEGEDGRTLVVDLACPRRAFWLFCADQTAPFDGSMALRVHARVPLGDLAVGDVAVASCRLGDRNAKHRVIWAVEQDRGARWLQVKVMFSRKEAEGFGDLAARVVVTAADGEGRAWGGDTVAPDRPPPPRDLASTEIDDALAKAGARFGAPREALEAALRATAATLGKGDVPAARAVADLGKLGRPGFRAVCALLSVGHHHYRTWELLRATYKPGEEKLLLDLAGEDLPGYANWTVLEGLGATGSDKARAFLLERISREKDLGLFMAAAKGLALLKERKAVPLVADRLIGSQGVELHLVNALGTIGGPEARAALKRYSEDERAQHAASARAWLERLD